MCEVKFACNRVVMSQGLKLNDYPRRNGLQILQKHIMLSVRLK